MNGQRKRQAPPAVGGSALLVILAVLCLTVFAVMALAAEQVNSRRAQASAQAAEAYYAAQEEAERILAQLRAGERPDGVHEEGDGRCTYACPIEDGRELQVELRRQGDEYGVERWQAVRTEEWTSDDTLELWDGTVTD